MKTGKMFHSRYFLLMLGVMIIMVAAYAFAAANTVPASSAGDGSGSITGYTVESVSYQLGAADPTVIDGVTFTLTGAHPANAVKIKLVTTSSAWFSCVATGGSAYSCSVGGAVPVLQADELRVVAAQ